MREIPALHNEKISDLVHDFMNFNALKIIKKNTVEPQLSEPSGRHTIRPDNRGVRIDEGNRNSPSVGYRVGDN